MPVKLEITFHNTKLAYYTILLKKQQQLIQYC